MFFHRRSGTCLLAKNIRTNNDDEKLDALARSLAEPMPRRRAVGLLIAGLLGFGLSPKRAFAGGENVNSNLRYQLKNTPCTDDMCSRGKICGVSSLPNKWGQTGCIKLGCCQGDQFCCAGPATAHGAVGGCCSKGFSCDNGKCVCYGKLSFSKTSASASFGFASQQGPICICPAAQVCGSGCCKEGEGCFHGECCTPERVCASGCCKKGEQCVDGKCCPAGRACGKVCCNEGEQCVHGECCPTERACGSGCCKQGEKCDDGECCTQEFQEEKDKAYRALLAARADAARVLKKEISDLEDWYKDQLSTWNLDYSDELKKCGSKSTPDPDCAQRAKNKYDADIKAAQKQHELGLSNARAREKSANDKAQVIYDRDVKNARQENCSAP